MLSLSLLLFVFLMTTMLQITDLIVNYRVGLGTVLQIMLYLVPSFMGFIIPMSTMIAVLLAFLKMSSDNEIVALKAGGVSLYHLMPPVLLFCVMAFFSAVFMTVFGLPWGKNAVKELLLDLNSSSYSALLKERTFNDSFKGIMIYVNKTDPKTKALIDVFVEDRNNRGTAVTITAPRGQMINSSEKDTFHLRLYDGFINQVQLRDKSSHGIRFETYDVRLNLSRARSAAKGMMKRESEMSCTSSPAALSSATATRPESSTAIAVTVAAGSPSVQFASGVPPGSSHCTRAASPAPALSGPAPLPRRRAGSARSSVTSSPRGATVNATRPWNVPAESP